ncbi:MAG: RnfABCDGE type electron transport complex subunit D [Treponema sp.]|nr:RnfABCDGE type electron transport complex subunit D [Treponema sp.]
MKTIFLIKKKYSIVRPFIYKRPSISSINIKIFIFMLVQIFFLALYKSYNALILIGSCTLASFLLFISRYVSKKEPIYNIFGALIQGLFIGMLLPETYPPFTAACITIIVLLGVRYMSSNHTNIWVNAIAFSILCAWFIGKQYFPEYSITSEMLEMKNPSLSLIQNGTFPISPIDSTITGFLNQYIFKFLKVYVPEGYISFLWDSHSLIPAFRFNILTILSSIVLFSNDSIDWVVPSIFLFVYALLVRLFVPVFAGGTFNSGDIILALFSSGTLFTALFLLQWFGTTPTTRTGKILYSIFCGIIAFILVGAGTSSIGMVYTILLGNIFSAIVKVLETNAELRSVKKAGDFE